MRKYAAIALLAAIISGSPARAETAAKELSRVIEKIVLENFFYPDPDRLAEFEKRISKSEAISRAGIVNALSALKASHTAYYTPDQIDYYELADICSFAIEQESKRLFAPDGTVTYPGIGMIAAMIGGALFVTDVYDGGPAAQAGVRIGDEILAVDGKPYREIASFRDTVSQPVTLQLRRKENSTPIELPVTVTAIQPNKVFTEAISASIRTIEYQGADVGYIRLLSFTSKGTLELIEKELGSGRLKDADALALDLRGRWGGAPLDAAEIFVGGTPSGEMVMRNGEVIVTNVRWDKPMVALIDEGTRSGLEVFAYALQKKGVVLIGENTAGAVLGGTAYLLPDDSLLLLAVADVRIDGMVLEGKGVSPDIEVARHIPFAAGADPQLEAALVAVRKKV